MVALLTNPQRLRHAARLRAKAADPNTPKPVRQDALRIARNLERLVKNRPQDVVPPEDDPSIEP